MSLAWCLCNADAGQRAEEVDATPPPAPPPAPAVKQPPAEPPLRVTLHRPTPQDALGMRIETSPLLGCFVVLELRSDIVGTVHEHNILSAPEERICEGDFIVGVNGSSDPETMAKAFAAGKELQMDLRRPKIVNTTVSKQGKSLGIDVKRIEGGKTIFVGVVRDGGAVAAAKADIETGDRIIAVNGRERAEDMLQELSGSQVVELKLARI